MNQIQYQSYSFKILSIIMLMYFFYHWSNQPLQRSLLLWSTLVISTPVPNASILLSFPAKIFFNIPLYISQIAASILSILFILFLPIMSQPPLLQKILRQRRYYMFIISIISSVLIANIIDDIFKNTFDTLKIIIAFLLVITYLFFIFFYNLYY